MKLAKTADEFLDEAPSADSFLDEKPSADSFLDQKPSLNILDQLKNNLPDLQKVGQSALDMVTPDAGTKRTIQDVAATGASGLGELLKMSNLPFSKEGGEGLGVLAKKIAPSGMSGLEQFMTGQADTPETRKKIVDYLAPTEEQILKKAYETKQIPTVDLAKRLAAEIAAQATPLTPMQVGLAATQLAAPLTKIGALAEEFLLNKSVDVKISPETVKDFYTFGKERLDPVVHDFMLKIPKEDLLKVLKAGEDFVTKIKVPRFGGEAPNLQGTTLKPGVPRESGNLPTQGENVPQNVPQESVIPSKGVDYLQSNYPELAKTIDSIPETAHPEMVKNAIIEATTQAEIAKINGLDPAQAEAAGIDHIQKKIQSGELAPKGKAEFIGYQETGFEDTPPFPLFNIPKGFPNEGSTITGTDLEKYGLDSPKIPSFDQWKNKAPKEVSSVDQWIGKSKIVDPKGNPAVVYHGTNADFTSFDPSKRDIGFHFAKDPKIANNRLDPYGEGFNQGSRLMRSYLKIENPIQAKYDVGDWNSLEDVKDAIKETVPLAETENIKSIDELRSYLESKGYDGIEYTNQGENDKSMKKEERTSYIAFEPDQARPIYSSSDVHESTGQKELERIEPSPLKDQPPKKLRDIIFDVSKGLGTKVVTGKFAKGGTSHRTIGAYYPGSAATVIKYAGDLDTTAHELAHSLDDKFGILTEWNQPGLISPFDDELSKFWKHGSGNESSPIAYKRAEGVAEFLRAYLVNAEEAVKAAPQFSAYILKKLPPETLKTLYDFSNDIRRFAGATAHEQIMANVNWKPLDEGLFSWFAGDNVGRDFKLTWVDKLQSIVQDDLHAFDKSVDYARGERGISEQLPKNDPQVLARLAQGVHAKMDDVFEHGMIDSKNNRITPGGIKYLLEPLDKSSVASLEKDMQETISYMIAQRTIEKVDQSGKFGKRVSGIGGGISNDVAVANQRLVELSMNPQKLEHIKEAARRYREWADATLKYMVDKGRLSPKSYEEIKTKNEYYVAMNRLMEIAPNEEIISFNPKGGGKLGSVGQPLQKFKGSTRTIENPYTSLMESTYRSIRESDRNEVLKTFRDLLSENKELGVGPVHRLSDVGRLSRPGEKNSIPIFVNGEKEVWQFHPEIYKAMKGLIEGSFQVPWPLTVPAKILRATIVNAPPFAVRNWIRDIQHRLIVSDVGSSLLESFKKRGPMDLENLRKFGGDQGGHYLKDRVDYMRALDTAMKDVVYDKKSILVNPRKLVDGYKHLMESTETSGRLTEYKAAFQHAKEILGYDDYNANLFAASKARGLMDFAIAGSLTRMINQLVPFTSAGVQGLSRTFKAASDNPAKFAGLWSLYMILPVLATYLYNYANGDIDEYRQQPAYLRDMFYNFKLGPDLWLRIPKSFEIGVLSTGIERALDHSMGNKNAFDGYGGSVARGFLPVDETALAGPYKAAMEVMANYDFFRQKHIIPVHEEKKDLDLRDTSRASRLGQTLQKVIGVDARNIDFLMREMFGYAGSIASDLSDVGRKDRKGIGLSQTGIVVGSPAYASQDVQWVLDTAGRRNLITNPSYKKLNAKIKDYFQSETSEEKDKKAQELRTLSSQIRKEWEKSLPVHKKKVKVPVS